jgi:hypothetical protein
VWCSSASYSFAVKPLPTYPRALPQARPPTKPSSANLWLEARRGGTLRVRAHIDGLSDAGPSSIARQDIPYLPSLASEHPRRFLPRSSELVTSA